MASGKIGVNLILVLVIVVAAGSFAFGGTKPNTRPLASNVVCCDSGDGDSCHPQTGQGQTLQFNGKAYGLIKSHVKFVEELLHLKDSGEKSAAGNPIIVNTSESHYQNDAAINQACNRTGVEDLYFKKNPPEPYYLMKVENASHLAEYCTSAPDDELVFECRENCHAATSCPYPGLSCYGDSSSQYDVYYRLDDLKTSGVPDFIKNCDKSQISSDATQSASQQIVYPLSATSSGGKDLQLKTFAVTESSNPWFSPLCKPAIYLYPPQATDVRVKIAPKGKVTLTIPPYPTQGWDVTAFPNGKILSGSQTFDYLYYEAQIPNQLIENKTPEGYMVEGQDMENSLNTILPQLGLSAAEKKDFVDYWAKVLPKSPYYFVGVVPQSVLNDISPLSIVPQPNTMIRVTLYFQPLQTKISVSPPVFSKNIRKGFTVVEWGGFFKRDSEHGFTCLM